ncbi:hypothetical protein FJ546_06705 [Mesorhizobium sp. B2-4-19]|nr:hypothetical protein FJ546_06705 [Mesorhizobium sp. B2-4-19]
MGWNRSPSASERSRTWGCAMRLFWRPATAFALALLCACLGTTARAHADIEVQDADPLTAHDKASEARLSQFPAK